MFFFLYFIVISFFFKFSLIYNLANKRPSCYIIKNKSTFVDISNKQKKYNITIKKKPVSLFKIKRNYLKYTINNDKENLDSIESYKEKLVLKIKNGVDKLLFVNRNLIEIQEDKKKELCENYPSYTENKKKIGTDKYSEEVDKLIENLEHNEIYSNSIKTYQELLKNIIDNNAISLKDNYLVKDYIDKIFYNYIHIILLNECESNQKEKNEEHDEKYDEEIEENENINRNENNNKKYEPYAIEKDKMKDHNMNKEDSLLPINKGNSESKYDNIINNRSKEYINKKIEDVVESIVKKLLLFKNILAYLINKYKIKMRDIYIDMKTYDIKVKRYNYEDNNEKKSDWKLIFLGTGSMYPSTSRGTSSFIFQTTKQKFNEAFLFDCGENTFISLQRANIKVSKIKNILITHLHGDHCLGLISVLTMLNSINRINIYGPEGIYRFLKNNFNSTYSKRITNYYVYELKLGNNNSYETLNSNTSLKNRNNLEYIYKNENNVYPILKNNFLEISGFSIKHTVPTIGYIIKELNVKNKFNASYINALIKNNYDKLKQCKNLEYAPYKIYENIIRKMNLNDVVIFPDQTKLTFNNAYKEIYKERKIVICQDTYDASSLEDFAKDADILIHESTNSLIDLTDNLPSDSLYGDNYKVEISDSQKEEMHENNNSNDISVKKELVYEQTNEYISKIRNKDVKENCIEDVENNCLCENKIDQKKEVDNFCEQNNMNNTKEEQQINKNTNLLKNKVNNSYFIKSYNKIISERGHSTANMAGNFAKKINAKKLILTHFSQRYIGDNKLKNIIVMRKIEDEALESFQDNNENEEYEGSKESLGNEEKEEKKEKKEIKEKDETKENKKSSNIYEDKIDNNSTDKNSNNLDFYDKKVVAAYDGLIVHIPPQKKK